MMKNIEKWNLITFSASAPAVHQHLRCITTFDASPPAVHHQLRCITNCGASPPSMHHRLRCITTFDASPPVVHHLLRYITTFSVLPFAVNYHLRCITTLCVLVIVIAGASVNRACHKLSEYVWLCESVKHRKWVFFSLRTFLIGQYSNSDLIVQQQD